MHAAGSVCLVFQSLSRLSVTDYKPKPKRAVVEIIDIAVDAALDVFVVGICTQDKVLADIKIKGT